LQQCLDGVLDGTLTVEQCLERYPTHRHDLKRELQVALLANRLEAPEMGTAQVGALESVLREKMAAKQRSTSRRTLTFIDTSPLKRLAAAVIIMMALVFGSGAGLVAASANSLPGDTLYPIKRLWEAIILLFSPLTGELDDLWLHLAQTRLDEIVALEQQGRFDQEALVSMYSAIANAIGYADLGKTPSITDYMLRARTVLASIQPPPETRAVYADVVEVLQPVIQPDGRLQPPDSELPPSLGIPPTPLLILPAGPSDTPSPTTTAGSTSPSIPTATPTATATLTERPTNTPRIPATATRTPTPTPSPTLTKTDVPTPTKTWTPLPLPGIRPTEPGPIQPQVTVGGPASTLPASTGSQSPFIRQTEQAVYLTQTAQAANQTDEP
jgi:hypothetical protein